MLNFNKGHKRANFKTENNLNLKEVLVYVADGIILLSLASAFAVILGVNRPTEKGFYVKPEMQRIIQNSNLGSDSEAVSIAERIDYYESIDSTFRSMNNSDEFYSEHTLTGGDGNPTFADFTASVEQTNRNLDYKSKMGRYIDFSEEEVANYKKQMFADYDVIVQYMDANKSADYYNLYSRVLNHRIQSTLSENGIEDFSLKSITIHEEDGANKHAELDMAINGNDVKVFAGGYLFDIFKSMNEGDEDNYVENINSLLSGRFDIDMESNEINNYTKGNNVGIGSAAVAVVMIGLALSRLREEETTSEKGKGL